MYRIEPHKAYEIPSIDQIRTLAKVRGIEDAEALSIIDGMRREQIRQAEKTPLWNMWEPPIWTVCDALLGFPWLDADLARRIREHLGFADPVSTLLINGGQRGSKSEYALNRGMRILAVKKGARAWFLHSNNRMSVEYQQPLAYKFLPGELKAKDVREKVANIVFTVKRGFTDNRFVLPNGNDGSFLTYEMDRATVEGGNVDFINPDELVPSDWVETMEVRHESIAFLCPCDGGEPDLRRALNLSEVEFKNVRRYLNKQWDPRIDGKIPCPWARPENCLEWLDGKTGQADIPKGRKFERIPRVMKCSDAAGKRAVVFFHSSDNPFGNPANVWRTIASGNRAFHKERFYGWANKTISARFPLFDSKVHVIPQAEIPAVGTNYLIVDPCSGRNMFMLWVRVTPDGQIYVYREWPNQWDYVPGWGVLGPWAEPCGKHADGRKGPAQVCLGWGLAQYKKEIARLEGWQDYTAWMESAKTSTTESESALVAKWDEDAPAEETIAERYLDAAFANVKSFHEGGTETLFEEFDDVGLTFFESSRGSRQSIGEGVVMINTALFYDLEAKISFFNSPRLHIGDASKNIIFAMKTWTGKDGQHGACKDPVDCLRMFFLKKLGYVEAENIYDESHGRY